MLSITFNNVLFLTTGFFAGLTVAAMYAAYRYYLADKRFQKVIQHIDAKTQKEKIIDEQRNVFQDLCNAHNIKITVGDKTYEPNENYTKENL